MPRRALPPTVVAAVNTTVPPPPPSPLIQKLRQDYRWASISQFCWTFSDAFGLSDWDIDRLEADFDGDETQLIPDLLVKLLFALTYNRQIKRDNVMENIRKQYGKRDRPCVLGTLEEPIEWATLGLGQKVQILYELCEIQMEDAARFRGLLKSEEDAVSWRIDPVGWDKEGNTYFLFDDNRLWVQRVPPAPPTPPKAIKKSSQKAKRALKRQRQDPKSTASSTTQSRSHAKRKRTPPPTEHKKPKVEEPVSGSRRRTQVSFYGNVTPTVAALKREAKAESTPSTSRSTRSTRGNPLDMASTSTPAGTPSKASGKGKAPESKPASALRGTRASRRGRDTGDEWQEVPAEWLNGEGSAASGSKPNGSNGNKRKLPTDGDDESDLSELTDEEEHDAIVEASKTNANGDDEMSIDQPQRTGRSAASSELSEPAPETDAEMDVDEDAKDADFVNGSGAETPLFNDPEAKEEADDDLEDDGVDDEVPEDEIKMAVKEADNLPEGFVEWEAVCVTLYDWRTFPEHFAKSRDPDEKALYHLLSKEVGPTIIGVLVEKAQELARQEAVINRKRSSRIATIQLSKEEALRQETAQREMEERMERTRYESTRQEREEAEHARREQEREARLREREDRAQAREEAILVKAREETEKAEKAERDRQYRAKRREEGFTVGTPETGGPSSGSNQLDRWELNCEICKKTGWNVEDDEDVVACEDCGRWQHMGCHDLQDMRDRRRKRDWDKVDFRCRECLDKIAKKQGTPAHPISSLPARAMQSVPNRPRHESSASPMGHHSAPSQQRGYGQVQHPSMAGQITHPHHQQQTQHAVSRHPNAPAYPGSAPAHHTNGHSMQGPPHGHHGQQAPYPPQAPGQYPARSGPPQGYQPQPQPQTHSHPAGPSSGHHGQYLPQAAIGSPRHPAQGPYQYGPPPDLASRSPYQGQHAPPHPQHQGSPHHPQSHPSMPLQTRQTPPHPGQQLPPMHYSQQYPPQHPQAQHYPPQQAMYQPHPAPHVQVQGHGHYAHPHPHSAQVTPQHSRPSPNGQYPPQQRLPQQRRSEERPPHPRSHPSGEGQATVATPSKEARPMVQPPRPSQAHVQSQ